jgi:hypothetical protein
MGLLGVFWLIFASGSASAAEPVAFATATGNCGDGVITFPIQASSHPNVVIHFRSIGAEGAIQGEQPFSQYAGFAPGDSGWLGGYGLESVEAGTSPKVRINCSSGSVEASLAEMPSTPATLTGTTTPGSSTGSYLPFNAPGSGQYVMSLTIAQGGLEVQGVSGIVQSSGEIPLGRLESGIHAIRLAPAPGPPAVWSATISAVPVAINKLAFGQTCMAPGKGIPATFSVTGDTTITAAVTNSAGATVRELGTFPVKEGSSSISWDGRGAGGASVPSGTYNLNLRSTNLQGVQGTAQTSIVVDSSGPTIQMTTPATILMSQSASFQVSDTGGCGISSVQITVTEPTGQTVNQSFGEVGAPLPPNGAISLSPATAWTTGSYQWTAKTLDKAGNTRTTNGSFTVLEKLPPKACIVPRVAGRKLALAKKLLLEHGCRVGAVTHSRSGQLRAGRVIKSKPKVGAHRKLHTKITLIVAKRLAPHSR